MYPQNPEDGLNLINRQKPLISSSSSSQWDYLRALLTLCDFCWSYLRLRMWLIRMMRSPASFNFSSIYLRRSYSIPLKLTIRYVFFRKTAKFDRNGHISVVAILCFIGEMAIWGTYDDGTQSSEVSSTWSGLPWRLSSGFGTLTHHLRDFSMIRRSRSTNITDILSAHWDET